MIIVYVLLFFLLVGLFVFFVVRYLEDWEDSKYVSPKEEYRKPKKEDITDL